MLKYLTLVLTIFTNATLCANTALYFDVSSSNDGIFLPLVLCLNGKGSLSCQTYLALGYDIFIKANIEHVYPNAGIRVNSDEYNYSGCIPYQNGYCIFRADNINYTNIKLIKK